MENKDNRQTDDLPNWNRFLREQIGSRYLPPGTSEQRKRNSALSPDKKRLQKKTGEATFEIKLTP